MSPSPYRLELLPNGYVRVDDRASGLVGLYEQDGTPRSGDLTYGVSARAIGSLVPAYVEGRITPRAAHIRRLALIGGAR